MKTSDFRVPNSKLDELSRKEIYELYSTAIRESQKQHDINFRLEKEFEKYKKKSLSLDSLLFLPTVGLLVGVGFEIGTQTIWILMDLLKSSLGMAVG